MSKSDNSAELARLVDEVLVSSKYHDLSPELVTTIGIQELSKRRNFKEALKATKNKLHQVGGAYMDGHNAYDRWLMMLREAVAGGESATIRQACCAIMGHHASTRERLPLLDQFYTRLFADLGPVESVLDLACGLNPLAVPWMPVAAGCTYYACDIYRDMLDFLAAALDVLHIDGHMQLCDIVQSCPTQQVDVALALKVLPCLEQVDKQAGSRLLHAVHARHLIVSFPAHSLGGRKKGMAEYYETHFRELLGDVSWEVRSVEFASELVFVVTK